MSTLIERLRSRRIAARRADAIKRALRIGRARPAPETLDSPARHTDT
jgi:hypothetical protein